MLSERFFRTLDVVAKKLVLYIESMLLTDCVGRSIRHEFIPQEESHAQASPAQVYSPADGKFPDAAVNTLS
jgi:hypothetical protein